MFNFVFYCSSDIWDRCLAVVSVCKLVMAVAHFQLNK